MTKFDYQQLLESQQSIDLLQVKSFDLTVYLVELQIGENRGLLYLNGELMRFHNTQSIRDAFAEFNVEQAELVHQSSFDEMIGNPPAVGKPLKVAFGL